jgi:hypothetical protein
VPERIGAGPSLDIAQYADRAWKIREGFPNGAVNAIGQAPDHP